MHDNITYMPFALCLMSYARAHASHCYFYIIYSCVFSCNKTDLHLKCAYECEYIVFQRFSEHNHANSGSTVMSREDEVK